MTVALKIGTKVRFTDGSKDTGIIKETEVFDGENYYLIERTYATPPNFSHWYEDAEIESATLNRS